MNRLSHDSASLVRAIAAALATGLAREMTPLLAEALGARVERVLGPALLTEAEVVEMLMNPLCAGKFFSPALLSERANNLATVAWQRLQERAA